MPYPNFYRRGDEPDDDGDEHGYDADAPIEQRLQALLPKDDDEMDQRWRSAENRALDRAAEKPYGLAEGVRDVAPMAVASLLDVLVNRGKGLGQIATGGMQANSMESSRRDAARAQAAKEAAGIRHERESGGDRKINAMHALLRGDELSQRRAEQVARFGDADEQKAAREGERGKTQAEIKKLNADAENAGLNELIRYMGMVGTQEGAAAKLAWQERVATAKERANELKAEELKNERERKADAERLKLRERNKKDFNRAGKDDLAQATILAGLEPLLLRYGDKDRPGTGELDSRVPNKLQGLFGGNEADSIALKSGIGKLFARYSHGVTGATSSDKERLYNQLATQLREGASEAETTAGLNSARKEIRTALRGLGAVDEESAREVLRDMGLEDFIYGNDIEYGGKPASAAPGPRPSIGRPPDAGPTAWPPPTAAAPGPTTQAQPEPEAPADPKLKQQLQKLMRRVPEGERDAVLGEIATLPIAQQVEELRRRYGTAEDYPAGAEGTGKYIDDQQTRTPTAIDTGGGKPQTDKERARRRLQERGFKPEGAR
jgi:hypothetical protein